MSTSASASSNNPRSSSPSSTPQQGSSASAVTSSISSASKFTAPSTSTARIPKLAGLTNYVSWSLILERYLRAHKLWSVVSGTYPKPDDKASQDELDEWEQANDSAVFTIISTLDESVIHLTADLNKTAKEIWTSIKDTYVSTSTLASFLKFKEYFTTSI